MRPGVSPEKAKRLELNAAKQDPKRLHFNKNLIAGRKKQCGPAGYSNDHSNVNQRINARHLGDRTLKEDVEGYKEFKKRSSKPISKSRTIKSPRTKVDPKLVKNLKTAGKVGLAAAALVGSGVVAKKMYDKAKKKDSAEGND